MLELHHQHVGYIVPTAPNLIILHGLFGSSQNWRSICRQLANEWQVYALDLRNHGQSPHDDHISYTAMAEDVIRFMDKHHIDTCQLLGHSMGGKVAMQIALTQPERLNKLVIVDIAPKMYPPRHQNIFAAVDMINEDQPATRQDADNLIQTILPDDSIRYFLLTGLVRQTDHQLLGWKMNMQAIRDQYKYIRAAPEAFDQEHQYQKPTLVIRGGQSSYITDSDAELFTSAFPDSQIVTIDDAGHNVHIEQTDRFVELVKHFFE